MLIDEPYRTEKVGWRLWAVPGQRSTPFREEGPHIYRYWSRVARWPKFRPNNTKKFAAKYLHRAIELRKNDEILAIKCIFTMLLNPILEANVLKYLICHNSKGSANYMYNCKITGLHNFVNFSADNGRNAKAFRQLRSFLFV